MNQLNQSSRSDQPDQNPTALVTGASTGIGRELARIHAERGGDLVVVARSEGKLRDLKGELESAYGVSVRVIASDLTAEEAPRELYDDVTGAGIEVEYLVNNAGFGGRGQFHERDWTVDRAMIQLNVVALTALCRLFLPDFVARNRGRILNVSSTASLPPGGPLQAVYFATKAYVTSFSYAIAEELHDTKVTVTALLPGATETQFAKTAGMDGTSMFDRTFSAREVAKDGYDGMLAGKLDVVTGVSASQRMLFQAMPFVPKGIVLSQVRKMQEVEG